MTRIPPSKHLSQRVRELSSRADAEDLAGQLARLGAQKLIQELLEAEVSEGLGRDRYERGGRSPGHRNGYKVRRLLTAEGALPVKLPQVRGTEEPFPS